LLISPAFRKQVLRLLEDKGQAGGCEVQDDPQAAEAAKRNNEVKLPPDPFRPPPGTKVRYRVCDLVACHLGAMEGTPKCELFWPEKHRDRAVAACAALLRQYGHRFRPDDEIVDAEGDPPWSLFRNYDLDAPGIHLAFRPLDHPATPEDARKGEAIFSLAGQGRVRVSKMPKLPRGARWITLKDYPVLNDDWGASGKLKRTIGYEQDGVIWQAEEVQADGRWQRYYGFVGRYGLAKVPAEEIEISTPLVAEEWIAAGNHLLVGLQAAPGAEERICVQKSDDSSYLPPMLSYRPGQPLLFKVQAYNRSGAGQPLPVLAEGTGVKARNGSIPMSLQLRYCPEGPFIDCAHGFYPLPAMDLQYTLVGMSWTQVPRKTTQQLTANPLGRKLMPTERIDCLQLDLKRLFDTSRPGTYRLSLKLRTGKNGDWQEHEVVFAK
jgi:hypothetical protein